MKINAFLLGLGVAVATLGGCSSESNPPNSEARETVTVTVTSPVTVAPTAMSTAEPAPGGVYSGGGVYSVGAQPSGGLQKSIPPGRYTVTMTPGRTGGGWIRCSDVLCGVEYLNHVIAMDSFSGADHSSVMEIAPTDVAVRLDGVTLTTIP